MPPAQQPGKGKKGKTEELVKSSVVESAFPLWNDSFGAADKEIKEKYVDTKGLALPQAATEYLDTWKRTEELVLNTPDLPMLRLKAGQKEGAAAAAAGGAPKPAAKPGDKGKAGGGKAGGAKAGSRNRELEGQLFAGHPAFEWLLSVMMAVISAQRAIPSGEFLWELIHPQDKDGNPQATKSGRYKVKLYVMDAWRMIMVDDRVPVDLFGRPLLVGILPLQLWPLVLSKAVLKVMAAYHMLDAALPNQAAAFQMLTGWPQEDLLDALGGTPLVGGHLFNRLEDALGAEQRRLAAAAAEGGGEAEPPAQVATCCLVQRAPRPYTPRIIVLAGPSAAGKSALLDQLAAEFPDRFSRTVSHTTRPPREHETTGQRYHFTTVPQMSKQIEEGMFLETAVVETVRGRFMYGTSLATVREVAATGKLCLMAPDLQGVTSLRANRSIEALYVYVAPPSPAELAASLRGKLREAESSFAKRLEWAQQQISKAATPKLFNHSFDAGAEVVALFKQVVEAVAELSPAIRNRLRGLPGYVLEYSDLIAPGTVEKPYLKLVALSGPVPELRQQVLNMLAREYPDVFGFPRITSTKPGDDDAMYRVPDDVVDDVPSSQAGEDPAVAASAAAAAASDSRPPSRAASVSKPYGGGGGTLPSSAGSRPRSGRLPHPATTVAYRSRSLHAGMRAATPLRPDLALMSKEQFEEALAGGKFVEHHKDLFLHPQATFQHGLTMDAIQEVIRSGRLPLVDLHVEGIQQLRAANVDCLSIFLAPPSIDAFRDQLRAQLCETEEDLRFREAQAAEELAFLEANPGVVDHVLVNGSQEVTYKALKALVAEHRPDVLSKSDLVAATTGLGGGEDSSQKQPVLVLVGPDGGLLTSLAAQVVLTAPNTYVMPPVTTDRKPAKGEQSTEMLKFVANKDLKKMVDEKRVATSAPDELQANATAVVAIDDVEAVVTGGKTICVLTTTNTEWVAGTMKAGPLRNAVYVYCGPASTDQGARASLSQLSSSGTYDTVVTVTSVAEALVPLQQTLRAALPDIVPAPRKPLVVCGPFGVGKRELMHQIMDSFPGHFATPTRTTTKPRPPAPAGDAAAAHDGYELISEAEAQRLLDNGSFLLHQRIMGHTYGITKASFNTAQASGRVCVLDVDHVADARALKDQGGLEDAHFIFVGAESAESLHRQLETVVTAQPPPGYEPEAAVASFVRLAEEEMAAAEAADIFERPFVLVGSDPAASFARLSEAVNRNYPEVVPAHKVWGYGRPLWDPAVRVYGRQPLRVLLLGAALSGKSEQARRIAERFGLPHVNPGDLLAAEVASGSALGQEAKTYMDYGKKVPDDIFFKLLEARLAEDDCAVSGWVLDGFPHSGAQAARMLDMGLVPDKVVLLQCEHKVLLSRSKYRRMDPATGKVYHMPEAGGLSAAIKPTLPGGQPDSEAIGRLQPRHDDEPETVGNRLRMFEEVEKDLVGCFEDVLLRLNGNEAPERLAADIEDFVTLESRMLGLQVTSSSSLVDLQYQVVRTLRHSRRQLLQLTQPGAPPADLRPSYWVDSKELVRNAHCILLHQDPSRFANAEQVKRNDLETLFRPHALYVSNDEPTTLLCSVFSGMQFGLEDEEASPRKALFLAGLEGVGRAGIAHRLGTEYGSKVATVRVHTSAPPLSIKKASAHDLTVRLSKKEMAQLQARDELAFCADVDGNVHGVLRSELEDAWAAKRLVVMAGPWQLAQAAKAASIDLKSVYLNASTERLDRRMRDSEFFKWEEHVIEHQLREGRAQLAAAREAGCIDSVVSCDDLQLAYSVVKELSGVSWHRPLAPIPVMLVVQAVDLAGGLTAGPTFLRLRSSMAAASLLRLPRGKHMLSLISSDQHLHTVSLYSDTPFLVDEHPAVLQQAAGGKWKVQQREGTHVNLKAGTTSRLFAFRLLFDRDCHAHVSLQIAHPLLRSYTQLFWVDDTTGVATPLPSFATSLPVLCSGGTTGYSLVAISSVATDVLEEGSWILNLESTAEPTTFTPQPPARSLAFNGGYTPNAAGIICRQVLTASSAQPTTLSLQVSVQPPSLPYIVRVLSATLGGKDSVTWATDYPEVRRYEGDGRMLLPNIVLEQGKYVVQVEVPPGTDVPAPPPPSLAPPVLGAEASKTPRAHSGRNSAAAAAAKEAASRAASAGPGSQGALAWTLVYMPSGEDKGCSIAADDSRDRYVRAVQDEWVNPWAYAAPGAKGGAGGGGAGKGASGAAAKRVQQAMTVLTEVMENVEKGGIPVLSRKLKDGTVVNMEPDAAVRKLPVPAEQKVLDSSSMEARLAALQEAAAAAEAAGLGKEVAEEREAVKKAAKDAKTDSLKQFADFRSKQLSLRQGLMKSRQDALRGVEAAAKSSTPKGSRPSSAAKPGADGKPVRKASPRRAAAGTDGTPLPAAPGKPTGGAATAAK